MNGRRSLRFLAPFLLFLISCTHTRKLATPPAQPAAPTASAEVSAEVSADREFRAAWVATVANINWPSKPGLPVDSQKKEALALLDFLATHHFNAVIFQVRPQADALYASNLEPWSYYLTGTQGKAPEPFYDPLQFWTEAAHDRGLELHVWLNPYRAHHPSGGPVTDVSLVKKDPGLVVPLKEGYWWFDPALRGTQDHAVDVVMDLVRRYDIDGVHFDDYFYPYPSYNGNADFPDSLSWTAYRNAGGTLSRGDWRREAVNNLIERLYRQIKAVKPYVKFGISPFGIWRPGHPSSIEGFDQYDQLYADAKLWLNKGWIDYLAPQLYWPINRIPQSYPVLLGWWAGENTQNHHLWPGISVGRDTSRVSVNETLSQIMIDRGMVPESKGVIHWSISSVIKNPALATALTEGPYKREALVPPSPWLDPTAPEPPSTGADAAGDSLRIRWSHAHSEDVFHWVLYYRYGSRWEYCILNRNERSFTLARSAAFGNGSPQPLTGLALTAVDRVGNESEKTDVRF